MTPSHVKVTFIVQDVREDAVDVNIVDVQGAHVTTLHVGDRLEIVSSSRAPTLTLLHTKKSDR